MFVDISGWSQPEILYLSESGNFVWNVRSTLTGVSISQGNHSCLLISGFTKQNDSTAHVRCFHNAFLAAKQNSCFIGDVHFQRSCALTVLECFEHKIEILVEDVFANGMGCFITIPTTARCMPSGETSMQYKPSQAANSLPLSWSWEKKWSVWIRRDRMVVCLEKFYESDQREWPYFQKCIVEPAWKVHSESLLCGFFVK